MPKVKSSLGTPGKVKGCPAEHKVAAHLMQGSQKFRRIRWILPSETSVCVGVIEIPRVETVPRDWTRF